ncbi:response regulator [Xanthomonas sp. NCPPB 2654]|uniref:response regulator n=1 Tax=unclassified Xanthomonas TaxID=2643310 RepID=UPI0021E059FA|nr:MULTISPECIES: response regulator [unclassified Xanthomonas]MDL5365726.1 response regulator [Xanthomonas sp. NCPPB 2654]MEB1528501.1 response regulator [Xanthomonas campestris pv. campestris]UYC19886.1 response regulator [Xanthomonas sp. CFBP 8443]
MSGWSNASRSLLGDSLLRILFVGDEASLPAEVTEYIRELGEDWQVQTVTDGNAAIAAAATVQLDAVIAAPALPDLTTATLLGQIRTLSPETIRIALIEAEQSNRAPPARIIGVAHRFLPLPLSPEMLLEAVTSIEELQELLGNPILRASIGRIEKLPSPPHLYLSLMHALEQDDGSNAADLAKLVSADPAIAAKVLQLCNSAYFSNGRTMSDLRTAVTRLGIATLRDLVLASEVFSVQALSNAERNALQQRSLLASKLASKMLPSSSAELGATAALLADIGLLLPGIRNEREPVDPNDDRPGHAEAGAYLLGLWGLPMPIIEAVAFHRQPQRSSTRSFWVTGAVHVAMALASGTEIDEDYLAKTGVLNKLPTWREQAESLMGLTSA